MKKTLVALAALAAAGSSFAQVTISGTFDPSIVFNNTTYGSGATQAQSGVENNRIGTSQVTFTGKEDLGGGLSASFRIENDFFANQTTGAQSATAGGQTGTNFIGAGGGDVFAALNGGFGSIKLGAPNTPTLSTQAGRNVWGTKLGSGFGSTMGSGKVRQSNSVRYDTPSFGGFSVAVDYTFGVNGDATAVPAAGNGAVEPVVDIAAFYTAGAISAGISNWKQNANLTIAGDQITTLYFSYDLGAAKLFAGMHNEVKTAAGAAGADSKSAGWNLGVAVPLGAVTIQANYAALDDKETTNMDGTILGLGVKYDLSKRTAAYARYVNQVNDAGNAVAAGSVAKKASTLVGIIHNF